MGLQQKSSVKCNYNSITTEEPYDIYFEGRQRVKSIICVSQAVHDMERFKKIKNFPDNV